MNEVGYLLGVGVGTVADLGGEPESFLDQVGNVEGLRGAAQGEGGGVGCDQIGREVGRVTVQMFTEQGGGFPDFCPEPRLGGDLEGGRGCWDGTDG